MVLLAHWPLPLHLFFWTHLISLTQSWLSSLFWIWSLPSWSHHSYIIKTHLRAKVSPLMTLLPRTFTWAPVPICLLNILTLISSEHLKLIVSQPSFSQSSPSQCWQPHHRSCCSRPAAFDFSLLSTQHSIYGHVHAAINIDPQPKTLHHLHCYQQASSIPSENIEIPTFAFLLLCLSSLLCLHSFFWSILDPAIRPVLSKYKLYHLILS